MAKARLLLTIMVLIAAAGTALGQGLATGPADASATVFRYSGFQVEAPRIGPRFELAPIIRLLGGELTYSPAAGTWAASVGDHVIQLAPDRHSMLVDGELIEADSPPVSSPQGVAVSLDTLDHHVLSPLQLHLEPFEEGYRIVAGATFGDPVTVLPTAADFAATTTLVLGLSRPVEARVSEDPDTGPAVVFSGAAPRLARDLSLRSRRVQAIVADGARLELDLADDVGLLSWSRAEDPPRIILELGRIQPTPTPAPVRVIERRGPPPVVIDPGHGGDDTGAVSPGGITEKELTLQVARRLAEALNRRGLPVRMTRSGDQKRALTDRTAVANRLEARAFISLHANASTVRSVRGAETYYMSLDDRATDAAAQATAELENLGYSTERTGSPLDLILWDMAQSEVLNESAQLALSIQQRLNVLQGIRDRGVKQAPFVVLTGATMPAALVEIGFLSNPDEATRLASAQYQAELAEAIAAGIADFLEQP